VKEREGNVIVREDPQATDDSRAELRRKKEKAKFK